VLSAWHRVVACLGLVFCLVWLHPAGGFAQVTEGPPRIRNVYIPADELKVLFGSSSKGVLMPRDEILALWREARSHIRSETVPPANTVLAQAAYEARLDDHELRVRGRIQIAKLGGDWQAVDLPFGGLAIESAELGGEPARFGRKDDGTLFLLLKKEGRVELELEMSAPLATKGGDLATTLKLPPAPASELLIRLDEGKQLQVGETTLQPDGVDGGEQVFRVAVDPTGLAPLVVSDRFAGGNRAPLVFAESRSTGHVEPAGLRWQVTLDLDVYARQADSFQLQLPDSVDVAEVEAPQLAGWTIGEQADGAATVTLTFRKPFLGRRSVRLLGLAPVPSGEQWNVPTVKVLGVASHVGQVLVYSSPSLRVDVGVLAGIRPERLSPPATNDTPMAFAFWEENFQLPLRVIPRRRTLQASVATLVEVDRTGLELRSSVTVEPRYAPVFDVEMQLSGDWQVTSVLSAGTPVEWESVQRAGDEATADASLETVRFDLAKPLDPGESLEIALLAQRHPQGWLEQDEGFSETPLPELRLVGADEVEGTVLVQAPADIELLVSDLSDDLQPVAADRSGGAADQAAGTALQYRYQDDARVSGRLRIRTKPAKVSAETLAYVRLDRGKLDVHYEVDLHVRHGKIRRIRFTLPAAVGEKIQIVPVDSEARVIEQRHTALSSAGDAGEALYSWQIVLDRPVTGELTLAVDFGQTFFTQSASDGGGESATEESVVAEGGAPVAVPVLALENVSRQSGMVALEAASDQEIDYRPENLRDLDPADVSQARAYAPSERIVAAYQYQRLPYRLTISATRHASDSVLTAVCESAEIISVGGGHGRTRHQARFWLRSRTLQHVPVTLPENADLWTVMLDSQPVEVRQKQGAYIVPLPARQVDSADYPRDLTLLYETDSPRLAADGLWGRLWPQTVRQIAPEIAMTTLRTTWHVHAPDGADLVSTDGDFKPVARLTRPTLVSHLAETIAHHSRTALGWKFGGLFAAAIIAFLFGISSANKGCGGKLVELLVVISIIGILIALLLPATQSAREAARRSQCTNNLKQIGLALHNYHDTYGAFPPAVIGPAGVPRERQFSWMVAILPYVEQGGLYDALRLDLPWDHPHNMELLEMAPGWLFCPSDPASLAPEKEFPKTSYVAITGADSTYGPGGVQGIFGFDRGLRMDEIVDGTSNTLMVGEVTDGGPWFAGGAGTARRIDEWIRNETWSHHPGGGNFVFGDGSVRFLSSNTDLQTLRHMATAQGGDEVGDEDSGDATATEAPPPAVTEAAPADREETPPAEEEPAAEPAMEEAEEEDVLGITAAEPTLETKPQQVAPQRRVQRGERARLSLRVALETRGGRAIRFRREGGPGELVLGLQDRTLARTLQWLIVAAALLAAWIGRRAPGPRRGIAVVLGLAVPLGLSGLVPLAWTPLLDGVLLGALAAGCLWILLGIIASIKTPVPARTAAAMAVGVCLLFAGSASAAEEARVAAGPQESTEEVRRPDLTLFIPYDPDNDKPLEKTQVYLPHDEFLRLWKEAHPEEPDDVSPEVRAIVSAAEYSGRLEKDVARFDGRLVIHHLDDQWVRVALPLGDVALEKVEINGRPATLADNDPAGSHAVGQVSNLSAQVSNESGQMSNPSNEKQAAQSRQEVLPAAGDQPAIYLEEPGLHVVDVRFSVPVSRLGATGQMTVPLRAAASGRLEFRLPADGLDVQVSGCVGGWRRQAPASDEDAAGESISVPLGAGSDLSIRWQPERVEARAGQLVNVDQTLLVEVLDSGVHLHGKFHYRIQQGALSEVQFGIPSDMAVQRVDGAEVADWSIETDTATGAKAESRRLVVSLKTELTTGAEVDVHCFRRDRRVTGTVDVHSLEPLGVVRETGRMAIGCPSHLRVSVDETDRVGQINRMGLELPCEPSNGCALLSAYRYTSRPWRVRLEVERRRPRVEVTDRTAVAVTARQVTLRSLLTAEVTGAPVPSFGLRLPASLRVSQVRVPPGADWFIDRDDQGQRLQVELNEPADGRLNLAVSGSLVRDSSQAEFAVPGIVVEEVEAQSGQLAVHLDDDLEAVLMRDGGARPIDPAALDDVLRPDGGRAVDYAFQYESPPEDLRLRLSAAPSRLNGDVITVVSVREGAVAYVSQVDFEVRQAGRSRFRIATPEWLGDDVELEGEHVRQIRSEVTDGDRIWDVELQQPVRGTYRVRLIQTLPLEDDGTVPTAVIRPLDVERSRSHVVLENLTADEIAATTTSGASPISIAAVPEGLTDDVRRQAVAAYRVADDAVLVWQRRVREQETGLKASISLADLTTVVHADGRYRARAAYNIRNFTLQFLELELPSDSRVWSVHVSDQPVRPAKIRRQGRAVTLLPLEKTSAGDFSSKVVVIYSGDLGEPLGPWTHVRPPAPQILSDVPVSRTLWTLLLPPEYKVGLVGRQSNLEEVAAAYQQGERRLSFLDELRQVVQVASTMSKSGAGSKAQYNLKQVGKELQDYAQQGVRDGASNWLVVQEQAQQLEAEIERLEEVKTDGERPDGAAHFYFSQRQRPAGRVGVDFDLDEDFEELPELHMAGDDKAALKVERKRARDPVEGRPEQQRGKLREQAAVQLEKLQTKQQEERMRQKKAAPQKPSEEEEGEPVADVRFGHVLGERAGEQVLWDGEAAPDTGADVARAGYLSLDLDLVPVGAAYHFRKLHGKPDLVLRVRHESLSRWLSAGVWAGLCLALATAAVYGLRRPNAAALAYRGWPWLAAVAGTAWLFLLPAGVLGLALLVTALSVLIARARESQTTANPATPPG